MTDSQYFYIRGLKYLNFFSVFLLFFMCQVVLQLAGGAFSNEFGGYSDEAGHYVTGLMVHDYIAGMQYGSPMEFAENYYLHYPKIALGHWPPFFYIVQGFWTLLFSESRISMMLLMALLAALLSSTVYLAIKRDFGSRIGVCAGIFLIALPLVQTWSGMLMAEVLVALLSLWSVLCLGRFLDTEKWQWSVGFGICATLAIMTKGNGLALVLVMPLALFFSRRFFLIKRLSFWYPLFIVLVFCGPWCWATMDMVRNGMKEGAPSLGFMVAAIPYFSSSLVHIIGFGLLPLMMVGFIVRVVRPYLNKETDGKWASLGALLLGVWLFHCIVPAGLEARHLITAVPALVIFSVIGFKSISKKQPFSYFTNRKKELILVTVVVVVFIVETFYIPNKAFYGYGTVAQKLLYIPSFQESVILVSSDECGEGAFISEIAMREQRPGHIVLRASKFLSKSRWDESNYELLYSTPGDIMKCLHKVPVGIVVIDQSIPEKEQRKHHYLLKKVIEKYPNRWRLFGSYPIVREGIEFPNSLMVYVQKGHENMDRDVIRLDMSEMLGRTIEERL